MIAHCCAVEAQPVNAHVRPGAPGIAPRVVDLRRDERRKASKQVKVVVKHRAARRFRGHEHVRTGWPRVTGDIVNVQRV